MSDTQTLRFGLREAVPSDAPAAWGARLIYPDDVVWDRTDAIGSDETRRELLDYLRSEVGGLPFEKARELHNRGELHPSGEEDVTLYEDDRVKVVANPRGSGGYLYVAAWLRPDSGRGNFDWRENQTLPGVAINPGTGPVHNATREQARKNMEAFLRDVLGERTDPVVIEDKGGEYQGRFTFVLRAGNRASEIDMPGLALDEVRYVRGPDQNVWDFPRLYENGSSWVWCYAVSQAAHSLFDEAEDA